MIKPFFGSKLTRRLLPLYVAVFLQGFILWYAIEKFFMIQIGFDDAGIGIMVAAYSGIMLLLETPSGILADRWSRKGVLILASVALAVSSLVCGLSQGIPLYLVGAGLWGVFFALYSGMYDSIIYDTLLEEKQPSELYERYYGRVQIMESVALVLGSLMGGFIAAKLGFRDTFYWTVVPALLSIGALLIFKEPKLHKQHQMVPISQHVKDTFGAVLKRGELVFILMATIGLSTLMFAIFEFNQLWWIALAMPVIAFGPANAVLLSTIGLGGLVAGYLRMHRQGVMLASIMLMMFGAVGLVVSRLPVVTVICQVVLGVGLVGLGVVFNRLLHDSLDSKVRSGASSAVSTLTRIVFIGFSLLFGFVSKEQGVFAASWLFVILLAACAVIIVKMFAYRKLMPVAVTAEDDPAVASYQK